MCINVLWYIMLYGGFPYAVLIISLVLYAEVCGRRFSDILSGS